MALIELPYGQTKLQFSLDKNFDFFEPVPEPQSTAPDCIVQSSLAHPLGQKNFESFATATTACIAINDKTRPVPYHYLLMPLIHRLNEFGISDQNITLLIATGTHTPASKKDIDQTIPREVLSRHAIRILSHNCDDIEQLIFLGHTRRGTPVWVNKTFYYSDIRIVTGNIEPHHFMGYSGGVKSAAIGLTGRETINKNHAMLGEPFTMMGEFERNPMRQDVEEIGAMIGVHFALNVLLNSHFEILEAFWGDPQRVMQAGIQRARALWFTPLKTQYDLVIASAGGHPKDINLYQAQKAITHAALFAKLGGTIVLAAACPDGIGSPPAEQFANTIHSPTQAIEIFRYSGFQIGPHKVYQLALQALKNTLILVSELPAEKVARFFFHPSKDIGQALQVTFKQISPDAKIAVLPHATTMIPIFDSSEM